jgi:hypothetical protein
MLYDSVPYKILRHFAHNPGLNRGVSIGDLIIAINVKPGTAVHQRMTIDVIAKDANGVPTWDIRKTPDNLYWMTVAEARRAMPYLKAIKRRHYEKIRREFVRAA